MQDLLILLGTFVGAFVLMRFVLPRLGLPS